MYREAAEYIKRYTGAAPEIAVILGSGLGAVAERIQHPVYLPYGEVPGFPVSTVHGHAGRFVVGTLADKTMIAMQGRVHYYEGYSMSQLAFPVQTLCALGVQTLVITNASGGIHPNYTPGQLVLIADHIKLDLASPLRGPNPEELGERFFDMTTAYSPKLRKLAVEAGKNLGFTLEEGIYAYMGGPQFETPAEIRMLRMLGADLVGMSTVPEVIVAAHCGMQVLGISCVTNMAAGMKNGGLNREVIARAEAQGHQRLSLLVEEVVKRI